jgi:hypothetical protein
MSANGAEWPYSQQPWVNREGPFPTPTEAELSEFERRHSIELPRPYRQFLLSFVGGPPEGCGFWIPAYEEVRHLHEMYPLRTRSDGSDLEHCIDWEEFIPRELLAFANDGYGSWFCIGIRGPLYGQVLYIWSEIETDDPRRIVNVAASFDEFMRGCQLRDATNE